MYHLKTKLTGIEQYIDGSRPYEIQSNTLVHSMEDAATLIENISESTTIVYSLISCTEVDNKELKALLKDESEAIEFKFLQVGNLNATELKDLFKNNPNLITKDGVRLVRATNLYGIEFVTLADTYCLKILTDKATASIKSLLSDAFPSSTKPYDLIINKIRSVVGTEVTFGDIIMATRQIFEELEMAPKNRLSASYYGKAIEGILISPENKA